MRGFDPASNNAFDHGDACDLDKLLHPSQAFERPADVVNDPDLSLNEKRAILASWASDACAVEAVPALRRPPGGKLRALDEQARPNSGPGKARANWRRGTKRGRSSDEGEGFSLT
jgi:hypothetical protein